MIDHYIASFHNNILGLRDFITLISPFLDEHQKSVVEQHKPELKFITLALTKHITTEAEQRSQIDSQLKDLYGCEIETSGDNQNITIQIKNGNSQEIGSALRNIVKSVTKKSQLYQSSLISLLSIVEQFLSQILHFYYDRFPESAGIKDKQISFEDLKKFATIKDAEIYLLDLKVESILRGSFEDWLEALRKDLKLSMSYVDDFKNDLVEIYQRRNILIHNGGIINRIYRAKVADEYLPKSPLGKELGVSKEYLEDALWRLELVFILIAAELWKKNEPDNENRANLLIDIAYENLLGERWELAKGLSYFIKGDARMSARSRAVASLNYWQCFKWRGEFEKVSKEVKEYDVSALDKDLQLGYFALTDNDTAFYELLPKALKSEDLSVETILEYPIFRNIRESEKLQNFLNDFQMATIPARQLTQGENNA